MTPAPAEAHPDGTTATPGSDSPGPFTVRLDNFEGPFDLLLGLISRHRLDITEVALSTVTDEFIGYIRAQGRDWDLEQTSQFLVVAATLLDLKAARLLPQGEVDDVEDLALLEARDLLFARLLQYRAFKEVASWIGATLTVQNRWVARPGGLEARFAALLPEVDLRITPDEFAALAARTMEPRVLAEVSMAHIHAPTVSVTEQAHLLADRLRRAGSATFRALTADADLMTTVARFLALLELYRSRAVVFEQLSPLAELIVRWIGSQDDLDVTDDYDEPHEEAHP